MLYLGSSSCTSFTKPGYSKTENGRMSLAMKTSIALVILVCLVDVRVSFLFIVNASCSRNCPVTPVLGVLDSELIELLLFSFLIFSMFIPCFLSKCFNIDEVEPVEYLICYVHIVHTVIVLSVL